MIYSGLMATPKEIPAEQEAFLTQPRGIEFLQNIFVPHAPEREFTPTTMLVDLDDTTKEAKKYKWSDGVERKILPETVAAFRALHLAGIRLGIVTEQAFTEITPFLTDVTKLALTPEEIGITSEDDIPYLLFNGLMLGEGGNVARRPKREVTQDGVKTILPAEEVVLAPSQSLEDRTTILKWLGKNVTAVTPEEDAQLANDGWARLKDVDPNEGTYVKIPPDDDLGKATLSLWEKGPHISQKPEYEYRYGKIVTRVEKALQDLHITSLKVYEAGNGTVRIVPKNIDKARTMGLLAALGAIDRKKAAYACDGPNDEKLAEELKLAGGGIIAVGNAIPRLRKIADYAAEGHAGYGFAEAVAQIIPDQYQNALEELKIRGLGLVNS